MGPLWIQMEKSVVTVEDGVKVKESPKRLPDSRLMLWARRKERLLPPVSEEKIPMQTDVVRLRT